MTHHELRAERERNLRGWWSEPIWDNPQYYSPQTNHVWESEEEKAEFTRKKAEWMTDHDYRSNAMAKMRREYLEKAVAKGWVSPDVWIPQ